MLDNTNRKLYLAYGSNLNKQQMASRCPRAIAIGTITLNGYQLVFRNVADIIKSKGSQAQFGLWSITPHCEKSLDRYEGFPNLYTKTQIELAGTGIFAMTYKMVKGSYDYPSVCYYDTILQGFNDFGLDTDYLSFAYQTTCDYIAEKDELEQNNSFKDSLKFVNNKLIHINGGNNGK